MGREVEASGTGPGFLGRFVNQLLTSHPRWVHNRVQGTGRGGRFKPQEEPGPMGQFSVILPAAGRSTRFGDPKQKKIFAELDGRAVWLRAVEPFINRDDVAQTIVVIAPEDRDLFERRFRASVAFLNIRVIDGGAERSDSVARALEVVDPACEFVAVHDAARPCLTTELIDAVFAAARAHGAALLAVRVADTVKRVGPDRFTTETLPRDDLYLAQTPQVFRR